MNLDTLFNPRSVAIIGASEKEGKVGNTIAKNVLELGYEGEIFLVNPKYQILFGRKCYLNIESIGKNVDLAIISVPAELVAEIIEKGSDFCRNFVVISAGFSEIGRRGQERERKLKEIAEKKNINILGPNCLGFVIPKIKLNASFAGGLPEAGNIAFISQSGALAVAIMDLAKKENLRFSGLVSIGNKAQIGEADLIEYFGNDANTKAIGIYLEGIKNGKKFMDSARRISKIKPVVILKSGKTEKAQEAITTHTGSLAGSDKIIDVVFFETGVMRADNLEVFLNLLRLASISTPPANSEAIVITNAGGPGVLVTDSFEGKKMRLSELKESSKNDLRKFLPKEASVNNPVDLLGDAQEDRYQKALAIAGQEAAGSVICVLTPQDQTPADKIANKIIEFKKNTNKFVSTVFIGGGRVERAVGKMEKNGIANFLFPHQALNALNKYYEWEIFRQKNQELQEFKFKIDIKRAERVLEIIKKAKTEKRNALLFPEAREIMKMYAIKTVAGIFLAPSDQLPENVEFPVVIKVESDKVLHKTEKKGVILNVNNQKELSAAMIEIRKRFPGFAILIQSMQDIQTELILGIKKDAVFGSVLVFGLGGIYAETFNMVDFLLPSVDLEKIKTLLLESKIGYLFKGARGKNPHNLDEMADIIRKLAVLSLEIEEIGGLDINPILVYNDGKEAVAVDVKIII